MSSRGVWWLVLVNTLYSFNDALCVADPSNGIAYDPGVLDAVGSAPEPRAILLAAIGCVGLMIFGWFKQRRA